MTEKQEAQEKRIPILDDAIEGLENGANIINDRAPFYHTSLQLIIDGTLGVLYDLINQTAFGARSAVRMSVLNYLDELIQRGVTPDRALEFIADCEHDKLPHAPRALHRALSALGTLISNAGPVVLAQLEPLKAAAVELISEMEKEGNGEATMADVIAKARAGLDMLRTFSTDPPADIAEEDFGEEHQESAVQPPKE